MKRLLGWLVSGVAVAASAGAVQAGEGAPRAVIELFTSQGCSSCPPADELMASYSQDPTLLALTFPVDYWDYLGWKDTFARPEFTLRQRGYAAMRGDRSIYTPQVVVNGREHVIGSDQAAIERVVAGQGERFGGLPVELSLAVAGDVLTARVGEARNPAEARATLWLVVFDKFHVVQIGRGENRGRSVTYSHVVRQLQPIGMWKGKPMTIELPRHDVQRSPETGVALVLQIESDGRPGPILGAARLPAPAASN